MAENTTISISKDNRKYLDDAAYERRLKSVDAALTALVGELEDAKKMLTEIQTRYDLINGIEREVLYKGDKTYINMPREWSGKKVKVIEVK